MDKDFITRTGKVFEAGAFPDKDFALTVEEMDAAIERFLPCAVNVEHMATPFDDGALGTIARLWRDGQNLFADVLVDPDIDNYFQKHAIPYKVSAEWDRVEKLFGGLALVKHPRITDAALMAAFAAPALRNLHDSSVNYGAECAGKSLFQKVDFMTPDELKSVQKVHDLCDGDGAHCDRLATRNQMTWYAVEDRSVETTDKESEMDNEKDEKAPKGFFAKLAAWAHKEAAQEAGTGDKENPSPPDKTTVAMSAEDRAKFAALEAEVAALKTQAADKESARQKEDAARELRILVGTFKMEPAEAKEWAKIAEEAPSAFFAALPALKGRTAFQKRETPFERHAPAGAEVSPGDPDFINQLAMKRAQEIADREKIAFSSAFSRALAEVGRENRDVVLANNAELPNLA